MQLVENWREIGALPYDKLLAIPTNNSLGW